MREIVRVTIRSQGKNRKFWAKIEAKNDRFTLYLPLKDDGDDKAYYQKDGVLIIPKELVANGLIVKEEPAEISKTYGWLEVKR